MQTENSKYLPKPFRTQSDKDTKDIVSLKFHELDELITETCPVSRERSVALTHLETAAMWVTKSLTHGDPNVR